MLVRNLWWERGWGWAGAIVKGLGPDAGGCPNQPPRAGTTADFLYLRRRAWSAWLRWPAHSLHLHLWRPEDHRCSSHENDQPPIRLSWLPFTVTPRQACLTTRFRCDPSGEGSMALTRYHAPRNRGLVQVRPRWSAGGFRTCGLLSYLGLSRLGIGATEYNYIPIDITRAGAECAALASPTLRQGRGCLRLFLGVQ